MKWFLTKILKKFLLKEPVSHIFKETKKQKTETELTKTVNMNNTAKKHVYGLTIKWFISLHPDN